MHASDETIGPRLRTMQIIAGALMAGVVIFLAVAVILAFSGQPFGNAGGNPVMRLVPFVMLAMCAVAMVVVSRAMLASGLQRIALADATSDLDQLLNLKQTILIVTLSLLEGPAFLGCIALMLEREPYISAVPLVALAGMALNFPTLNSVRQWLEINARRVLELRENAPRHK